MTATMRVFVPGEGDDPGSYSLRKCYEEFCRPELEAQGRARGTFDAYETALKKWEEFSSNPPVEAITEMGVAAWRDRMTEARQNFSPATLRKYWRHLTAIFGELVRRGLIVRAPTCRLPRPRPKLPRLASHVELNALYDSCRVASWPLERDIGLAASALWRTFIVLAYNYGPRTRDLWRLPTSAIDWERATIRFQAAKTSKLQGLPFNATVEAHLHKIRRPGSHLFHPTGGNAQFYREWAKINAAAGLSVPLECRDLRETAASNYEAISPGVGSWILGHGPKGVTASFYLNPTPQVLEAVQKLPQPQSFITGPSDGSRQRRLF